MIGKVVNFSFTCNCVLIWVLSLYYYLICVEHWALGLFGRAIKGYQIYNAFSIDDWRGDRKLCDWFWIIRDYFMGDGLV